MKKFLFLYIIGCVLAGYFWTSCSNSSADKQAPTVLDTIVFDSLALRVGYAPTLDVLPLLVAEQAGVVDSLQLDLQLIPFTGFVEIDSAVVKGLVHVALTDICHAIQLNEQDEQLKIAAGTTSVYQLVTQRQLRIRRLSDLPERMIAITANDGGDWMLDQLLTKGDIAVDAVNRPQIQNLPLRAEMVAKEMIDAAILPEPYATQCAVAGDRLLGSSEDLNLELGSMVIPANVLQEKKSDLQKMAMAYNRGVALLNAKKSGYSKLLQAKYKVDEQTTDSLRLPEFKVLTKPDFETITKATNWLMNRYSDQDWLEFRILRKDYNTDKLFDYQLIHE